MPSRVLLWSGLCVILLVTVNAAPENDSMVYDMVSWSTHIIHALATDTLVYLYRNRSPKTKEIEVHAYSSPEKMIVELFVCYDDDKRCADVSGKVKDAEEAWRLYQEAVRNKQMAAYVEESGFSTDTVHLKVKVSIPPDIPVKVSIKTQSVMRRSRYAYAGDVSVYLKYPTKSLHFDVIIQDFRQLTFLMVAPSKDTNGIDVSNQTKFGFQTMNKATISCYLNTTHSQVVDTRVSFAFKYGVITKSPGGDFMVLKDGYFIHYIQPGLLAMPPFKDIVFVLEVSDVMGGSKIKDVQVAMRKILNLLDPHDRFLIILYGSRVCKKKSLIAAQTRHSSTAEYFISRIKSHGLTNINDALKTALRNLNHRKNTVRVGLIFFLNSGQASIDETNPRTILTKVAKLNKYKRSSIYSFGLGREFDENFLYHLSAQNFGFLRSHRSRYASNYIVKAFKEIYAVALENMNVSYPGKTVKQNTLTQTLVRTAINRTEAVICGRIRRAAKSLRYTISGGQQNQIYSEVENLTDPEKYNASRFETNYSSIPERIWAITKISQLWVQRGKLIQNDWKLMKLNQEILRMSLKYRVVTPLTAMYISSHHNPDTFVWQSNLNPNSAHLIQSPGKSKQPRQTPGCQDNLTKKKNIQFNPEGSRLGSVTIDPGQNRYYRPLKSVCVVPEGRQRRITILLYKPGLFVIVLFMDNDKGEKQKSGFPYVYSIWFYTDETQDGAFVKFRGFKRWFFRVTGSGYHVSQKSEKTLQLEGEWFQVTITRKYFRPVRREREVKYQIRVFLYPFKDMNDVYHYQGLLGTLAVLAHTDPELLPRSRNLRECRRHGADVKIRLTATTAEHFLWPAMQKRKNQRERSKK